MSRVTAKLPPFWPERPALWFAQVEAQFALCGVTNEITKFNYVVSQLEHRYAAEVEDIITSPPPEPYRRLKEELVQRLSTSQEQRIRQLLTVEELGDRKPSQFLRHLRSLAPAVPDDFLRSIWSGRLPTHLQSILASQPDSSLDSLSRLADRVHEVAPQIAVATATPQHDHAELLQKIEELTHQVAALQVSRGGRPRSRSSIRSSDRPRSRDTGDSGYCWYHSRFGYRAQQCRAPCSFSSQGNETSSR